MVKVPVKISVDVEVVDVCKENGINMSEICRKALRERVNFVPEIQEVKSCSICGAFVDNMSLYVDHKGNEKLLCGKHRRYGTPVCSREV